MSGSTVNVLADASAQVEMNIRKFKGDEVTNSNIKSALDLLVEYAKTGVLDLEKVNQVLGKGKKTKKEKAVEK